ncbi:MAG: hypothetical protein CMF62_01060 [Magnetococcales bacterium]|nr:hypothetical protein [Magnetococcales bacterium]
MPQYNRNRRNEPIKNNYIQNQVINYVYKKVELANFKFRIINSEDDLKQLRNNNHYLSPNYNGINCLMVFKKIKDKFVSCLIDRRSLSYKLDQVKVEDIKFTPINLRLEKGIYNGTIFDGILLHPNETGGRKVYIINDVYYFRGEDFTRDKINHKVLNISTYLNQINCRDNAMNNITLILNELYDINRIQELTYDIIPKMDLVKHVKGVCFYPEVSATKLIYIYDIKPKVEKSTETKDKNAFLKKLNSSDDLFATFEMRKTETSDVYELYLLKKMKIEGKKVAKNKLYDIAYIPTTDDSIFCKNLFDENTKKLLVKCKYVNDRNKLTPYKVANDTKRADTLSDIKKKVLKMK